MLEMNYYQIGSEVSYLRHDTDLVVHEEVGTIRAIFLDQSERLMAQVKNGSNAHNVHYGTIGYDAGMVAAYTKVLQDIRDTSDEGDDKVNDVVVKYNAKVDNLTTELFGEPVSLEVIAGGVE